MADLRYRAATSEAFALPAGYSWHTIEHNGTHFCALGFSDAFVGHTAVSVDGIDWTVSAALALNLNSLCWTGTQWVAVHQGASGRSYTSPDGLVWTQRGIVFSSFSAYHPYRLAANGAELIALPYNGPNAARSTDGITWTEYALGFTVNANMDIAWTGNNWMVVAESGFTPYQSVSANGTAWSASATGTPYGLYRLVRNGTRMWASDAGSRIYRTDNEATWTLDNTGSGYFAFLTAGDGTNEVFGYYSQSSPSHVAVSVHRKFASNFGTWGRYTLTPIDDGAIEPVKDALYVGGVHYVLTENHLLRITDVPRDEPLPIASGTPITGIAGKGQHESPEAACYSRRFYFDVPAGTPSFTVTMDGQDEPADSLYFEIYYAPTTEPTADPYIEFYYEQEYIDGAYNPTNDGTLTVIEPSAGRYYLDLDHYDTYEGATLSLTVESFWTGFINSELT